MAKSCSKSKKNYSKAKKELRNTQKRGKRCYRNHNELEAIHPFSDGNGRMGRFWQSVMSAKFNPLFAWLPVETMGYENQTAYYQTLQLVDEANDSTVFIEFMLTMINQAPDKYSIAQMSDKLSGRNFGITG